MVFPDRKCFLSILHLTRSPFGLFVDVCYCCKINKALSLIHLNVPDMKRFCFIINKRADGMGWDRMRWDGINGWDGMDTMRRIEKN